MGPSNSEFVVVMCDNGVPARCRGNTLDPLGTRRSRMVALTESTRTVPVECSANRRPMCSFVEELAVHSAFDSFVL